jgi:chemotaxis protein MotB
MSASLLVTLSAQAPGRAWLITFVDLILLLLTFFVLMFSMSQPDPAKYAPVAQSYAEAFSPGASDEPAFSRARSFVSQAGKQAEDLAYLETALKAAFGRSAALSAIRFRSTDHYLMISLPSQILGQGVDAANAASATLFELGGVFANINNRLAVIGMADQTAESWTDAIRRSARIAQSMTQAGYDRPIATLARVDGTANGSVEIMIMADRLSETGPAP